VQQPKELEVPSPPWSLGVRRPQVRWHGAAQQLRTLAPAALEVPEAAARVPEDAVAERSVWVAAAAEPPALLLAVRLV